MPNNPQHPEPSIAQPGKLRPEQEIRQPGQDTPARDADPDPLGGSPLDERDPPPAPLP